MKSLTIKKRNLKFVLIIGLALGTKQFATNLVTPFIASYTQSLLYGSLLIGGIALGIFSLTQGFLQIPFGRLYDKIGGKKVLLIGLGTLIIGLLLSCITNNAYVFLFSRALQGSGAITAAGYSWISSSVSQEERANSIGIVGAIIGLAAAISLGGGPFLVKFISIRSLYIIATILISIVFLLILFFLQDEKSFSNLSANNKTKTVIPYVKSMFLNINFISYISIAFIINYIGMSGFFIIPQYLQHLVGINGMWKVLTPSIVIAVLSLKFSTALIKKGKIKFLIILSGIFTLLASIILLLVSTHIISLTILLLFIISLLIFIPYMILSSLIPTVINTIAKNEFRGILNGINNLFIYIGACIGASLAGALWEFHIQSLMTILIIFSILMLIFGILLRKKKVTI